MINFSFHSFNIPIGNTVSLSEHSANFLVVFFPKCVSKVCVCVLWCVCVCVLWCVCVSEVCVCALKGRVVSKDGVNVEAEEVVHAHNVFAFFVWAWP